MTGSAFVVALLAAGALASSYDPLQDDIWSCLLEGKEGCLEGRVEKMLETAGRLPVIRITRDLSIVSLDDQGERREERDGDGDEEEDSGVWGRIESYLYGHALNLEVPRELTAALPPAVAHALPRHITVPLAASDQGRSRRGGLLRKVILPFLLGLKFKATAVIPLAMALIALKTWKALTLGLLSIVLSGAMVIFRLTRPKVSNLELYYPPPHHHSLVDHPYDHHYAAARGFAPEDAQRLAYSAQLP